MILRSQSLYGRSILILEDEYLTGASLERELAILGATVTVAGSLVEGLEAVKAQAFDAAVLDIKLHDGTSQEVAAKLRMKGTPFVFVTGYGSVLEGFADAPVMHKPVDRELLARRLAEMTRENP